MDPSDSLDYDDFYSRDAKFEEARVVVRGLLVGAALFVIIMLVKGFA